MGEYNGRQGRKGRRGRKGRKGRKGECGDSRLAQCVCGIGTARRRLPAAQGGWTVGVLVQSNYGAVTVRGPASVIRALPLDSVIPILREHRAIR
jgi:hypothetical protein